MNTQKLKLRKLKLTDKKYFAIWWRDNDLIKLTSGVLGSITDEEVNKYFLVMFQNKNGRHFMIMEGDNVIGHISLVKRKNEWYETQVVIGEKEYWDKGYGTKAIDMLIKKAKKLSIVKIYLEVRPTNARAIKSYEKSGFVKAGIKKYPKNKYLPEALIMRKHLFIQQSQ